jgi:two-component system chemotaxis sensor kinase CheA
MEVNQYLPMFIEESKEHLQAMNENLLNLENNPHEISLIHHIFRSAHTLKGMSATMGFEDLASLTHEMENVLDLVRNNKLEMDSFIFECVFKSVDSLESMIQDIIQGGTGKADVTEIIIALQLIVTGDFHKQSNESLSEKNKIVTGCEIDEFQYSVLQQSIDEGNPVYVIKVCVREDCVLKAARAYMVFNLLERYGEVVKSTPSMQDIEQGNFDRSIWVYYISQVDKASLENEILSISEIDEANVVKVNADDLANSLQGPKFDTLTSEPKDSMVAARHEAAPATVTSQTVEVVSKSAISKEQSNSAPMGNRTIRVDIERLDALMNLFSELLIDRVRLEQLASEVKLSELTETVEHISRVSSDLQNIVLKLRMVPVNSVFNRFPRMVRDVAKSLNKKVDLIISGAETELDRTVIDELGDPLVHLLRNAVDHGIESIGDRIASGKNETGSVHLRAFHSGNHVIIEVEEDGAGISHEKVLQRAVKNGLIPQDQAEKMNEHEIAQLIFESGFSTADKISDISGRGVGLDVVKTKIQSLGGHVSIESRRGLGTKFSVQLPLTLSIISAMIIRTENEKYAIPLSSIVETSAVKQSKICNIHGNRMIEYRNMVIPVISLRKIFEVPVNYESNEVETEMVIIRKGEKIAALLIDEFIGQNEIVLKSLGKFLNNLFAISGATILGDGQVALIIDSSALIK